MPALLKKINIRKAFLDYSTSDIVFKEYGNIKIYFTILDPYTDRIRQKGFKREFIGVFSLKIAYGGPNLKIKKIFKKMPNLVCEGHCKCVSKPARQISMLKNLSMCRGFYHS